MGGFKCLERMKENEEILDSFQEIAQVFNTFSPLHIEKCKIFLNTGDYENAMDYIDNISNKLSSKNFEIFKILSICSLVYEGDFKEACKNIDKMIDLIFLNEPKNPELYYTTAKLFSRICENRPEILKKCDTLIKKAIEFSPRNAKYLIEQAFYKINFNDLNKGFELFKRAGEIDVNNKESSFGLIQYKITLNKLKEASEDIDFLKDIFQSLQKNIHPKLIYFEAVIKYLQNESEEYVGAVVTDALNNHVKFARSQVLSKYDILIITEYDFLFQMAKCKKKFFKFFKFFIF
jgi:tetratricopeptide (TPR) repeat protein